MAPSRLCTWCYILAKRSLVAQAFANKRCIESNIIGTLYLLPKELTLTLPTYMPLLLQLHRETELTSSSHSSNVFGKGLAGEQYWTDVLMPTVAVDWAEAELPHANRFVPHGTYNV